MRSILTLGLISFAMTFCGLADKLKGVSEPSNSTSTSNTATAPAKTSSSGATVEKSSLTDSQQAVLDSGSQVKWDDQGIAWTLPKGWSKMDVKKEMFTYKSPDNAFLIVSISLMPDSFPMDTSMKAYYEQAQQQLKNGKYESARMLEIDGIQGVEFTEAPPEGKEDPRRHQWIAYRTYLGQKQQLNVMTSTKGTNFSKHTDDFAAILYSMKVTK